MTENTEQNLTIESIIEQSFDFSAYGPEEKKDVIAETAGMVMEATMLRVLNDSSDELQEKFGALVESEPTQEVMAQFIQTHFSNFGKIVVDEIAIFKSIGQEQENKEITA